MVLQWDPALISRHAVRIETFNEFIVIILLYHLLCFSDYIEDPVTRDYLGWAYICSMGVLVLVHLFFLIVDMLKKLKIRLIRSYLVCRYRYCCRKAEKIKVKLAPQPVNNEEEKDSEPENEDIKLPDAAATEED